MSIYSQPTERFGEVYDKVLPHDFTPGMSDREAYQQLHERLEVEGRVKYDEAMARELEADNPRDAEALQEWLEHEKQQLKAADVEIDDEMLAEAAILDEIIADLYADHAPANIIKLAEVQKDKRLARRELKAFQTRHSLAA